MKCPKCGFNADNCNFCPICGANLSPEEPQFQSPKNQVNYAFPQSAQLREYQPAAKKTNVKKPLVITALVILGVTILAGLIISVYSAVAYNKSLYEAMFIESYISGAAVTVPD